MDDDPIGTIRQETFASGHSLWAYLSAHSPVWDDHKPRWVCIYSTHAGNIESDLAASDVGWLMENTSVIGAVPGTPAAAGLLAAPAPTTLDLQALAAACQQYMHAWRTMESSAVIGSLAQRIAVIVAPAASPAVPADDEAAAQKAWETFRVAYSDYQKKNPSWQAFWTDHHAFAFNAALAALREGQQ